MFADHTDLATSGNTLEEVELAISNDLDSVKD